MSFTLELNGQFDFSKCRGLAIRGYNKVKLYSTVYSHIRDCEAFDPVLIRPKVVIDAVGTPDPDRGINFIIYSRCLECSNNDVNDEKDDYLHLIFLDIFFSRHLAIDMRKCLNCL